MSSESHQNARGIRESWDERAATYDAYYETFRGAVEHYVDWTLLKAHLPPDSSARILDAAGGTGRMTIPLAKMGYHVTLCDISHDVGRRQAKAARRGPLGQSGHLGMRRPRHALPEREF